MLMFCIYSSSLNELNVISISEVLLALQLIALAKCVGRKYRMEMPHHYELNL